MVTCPVPDAFLTATPWVSMADTVDAVPSNPATPAHCSAYLFASSALFFASAAFWVAVASFSHAKTALPAAAVALSDDSLAFWVDSDS